MAGSDGGAWALGGAAWLIPDNGMLLSLKSVKEERVLGGGRRWGWCKGPLEAAAVDFQLFHI